MNWIENVVRPKIRTMFYKREVPENLWIKCPSTGEMVFHRELEANHWVVPSSDFHMQFPAAKRLDHLFGEGQWTAHDTPKVADDPLKFRDARRYSERIREARTKTGRDDAVIVATGELSGLPLTAIVQDFSFMAGSLGRAAGEAIIKGLELALEKKTPAVLFAASGGARMQEGILSLMQMPRTTIAVEALKEAGLPYIVVLTNPTTGGVSASYAMLGDIHIAEPGALIGFAGRRVIEQTIREQLPDDFQKAEYLMDHGMVDMVVHRHDLPDTLARVLSLLLKTPILAETMAESEDIADEVPVKEDPEAGADAPQVQEPEGA